MKRKKIKILLLAFLGVLLVAALWVGAQVRRINSDADLLATTGTTASKMLSAYGAGIKAEDPEEILKLYADDYSHPDQGFWQPVLASDRDGIQVYDWQSGEGQAFSKEEIREQLRRLLEDVDSLQMAKLKLASVEEIGDGGKSAVIRTLLWVRGTNREQRRFESQAMLRFWLRTVGDGWQITRQELLSGKTVNGDGKGFVNIAQDAGIDFVARQNPIFETETWRPRRFGIIAYGAAGVSAVDYDGDGWEDLFFADGQAPRLYRNLGTGEDGDPRFADVTSEVGLPEEEPGVNIGLFVDLDNDGDKDLLETRFTEGPKLYRNDGPGPGGEVVFTDVTDRSDLGRPFTVAAAAADYDLDGDLDLYLGRYLDPRVDLPTTLFYTRNGQGNSLLRNDGDFTFTDVTEEAGVREGGLTLGTAWADYDQDGDPDLFVANDFGRNALLRNEGPDAGGTVRFTDVSAEAGALDFGFGMSASWGDPDNDGDLDLYVSNVHSGQRWYGQSATLYQYLINSVRQGTVRQDFDAYREIYRFAGADWRDFGDGMVKGNSLMINQGDGTFVEVSEKAGSNPFGWYWGSAFLDYDNDGRQDVYAANGWISSKTYDDL
ncbi:MAG: VCBS repeat-containing protein [Acidobacteria bacterium]|nr:VCBS repeat-containing protein [Acidobacteriota bacterium]